MDDLLICLLVQSTIDASSNILLTKFAEVRSRLVLVSVRDDKAQQLSNGRILRIKNVWVF